MHESRPKDRSLTRIRRRASAEHKMHEDRPKDRSLIFRVSHTRLNDEFGASRMHEDRPKDRSLIGGLPVINRTTIYDVMHEDRPKDRSLILY